MSFQANACVSSVLCPFSAAALTLVIDAPILIQVRDDQQLLQLLLVQGLPNHLHGGLQLVARYKPITIPIEYSADGEREDVLVGTGDMLNTINTVYT